MNDFSHKNKNRNKLRSLFRLIVFNHCNTVLVAVKLGLSVVYNVLM